MWQSFSPTCSSPAHATSRTSTWRCRSALLIIFVPVLIILSSIPSLLATQTLISHERDTPLIQHQSDGQADSKQSFGFLDHGPSSRVNVRLRDDNYQSSETSIKKQFVANENQRKNFNIEESSWNVEKSTKTTPTATKTDDDDSEDDAMAVTMARVKRQTER